MKHGWLLHIVNDALSPITLEQITFEAETIKKSNTVQRISSLIFICFPTECHLAGKQM